jgi:3-oxoacyl-(acyl-carrier-protein) synthase
VFILDRSVFLVNSFSCKHSKGETQVKPNVGHSEGASGITSLIKAVLALENRTIPPNIKFSTPNPKSRLFIVC